MLHSLTTTSQKLRTEDIDYCGHDPNLNVIL